MSQVETYDQEQKEQGSEITEEKIEYSHMDKASSWLRFLRAKKLQNPRMNERQIIAKFRDEYYATMHQYMTPS